MIMVTSSFSQSASKNNKLSYNAGVEAAIPLGDFSKTNSFGIGATAQADYSLMSNLDLTLNAGYITFSGKSETILGVAVKYGSVNVIPVMAGARYWFNDKVYGSAQLGLSFWSVSGTSSGTNAGSENNVTWAPGIGYKFSNVDVLLKYNSINASGGSLNSLALRAAYHF